jgi:hypothetical protein
MPSLEEALNMIEKKDNKSLDYLSEVYDENYI